MEGRTYDYFCRSLFVIKSGKGFTPSPFLIMVPALMSSADLWYITLFSFGCLCGWAIVKGISDD